MARTRRHDNGKAMYLPRRKKSRRAKIRDLRRVRISSQNTRGTLKMKMRLVITLALTVAPEISTIPRRVFVYISRQFLRIPWLISDKQAGFWRPAHDCVTDSRVNDRRNRRVLITGQSTHFLFGRAFPDNAGTMSV